jgi:hypothetical protein
MMVKLLVKFLIISIVGATMACTEVSFPTHQPKGVDALAAFPAKLQGRYTTSESDSLRDTLIIERVSYRFTSAKRVKDNDWLSQGELSDSLVIKEFKKHYFINFKENDQWLLRILKQEHNGDLTFRTMAVDGTGKDKLFSELQKELSVEVIQVNTNDKYYRIDPSPKKLLQLMKKKKFWEESTLVRIK